MVSSYGPIPVQKIWIWIINIVPSGYVKIAIENGPSELVDLPIKDGDLSIAMLVYQRVILETLQKKHQKN